MIKKGMMLSEIPFANISLILKNKGMDFFILDCEHGGFDYSDISKIIMTAKLTGISVIIRLPDNTRKDITRFMDMGADGLLLPMTNSLEDIQKVVGYAKYSPQGKRGISTLRAHTFYNPPDLTEYMAKANENVKVFAQIETEQGLKNLHDIASCQGVDGIIVGPNDLACDLGCLNETDSPLIMNAIKNIAETSEKYGKLSGIITSNNILLKQAKQCEMSIFCIGSELSLLSQGLNNISQRIDNI